VSSQPQVIVIAGPNGAGKSTAAAHFLPEEITFVNADDIARALPGYPATATDRLAGRLHLAKLDELEKRRADFAVETTLASRTLAPRVKRLREAGYHFRLVFLYLPHVDIAVKRVAGRVLLGGHGIPDETIRRRYKSGIRNFFEIYQPLADKWDVYNTIQTTPPELIACGIMNKTPLILNAELWSRMQKEPRHE
jgi:predicted ABC-type ATPase